MPSKSVYDQPLTLNVDQVMPFKNHDKSSPSRRAIHPRSGQHGTVARPKDRKIEPSGPSPPDPASRPALAQRDLVARAFAGDDVVEVRSAPARNNDPVLTMRRNSEKRSGNWTVPRSPVHLQVHYRDGLVLQFGSIN